MLGALIGDIVGSYYEFDNTKRKDFKLINDGTSMTDDSIMTTAVMEICENEKWDDNDYIIKTFKKWGQRYPRAGYGARFVYWVLSDESKPYNSCGNGSAMRISPCGWFGNSEEEVKHISKQVTQVTHNHPEGIKGAEVVAMCIYYARIGKDKEFIKNYILTQYPEVANLDYDDLVANFYHGAEICQATVPQALYCFLISSSFEDCLRTTISIGGDCDTTSAMSCAIAEAYYGIPEDILNQVRPFIKPDVWEVMVKGYKKLNKSI